MSVLLTGYLAVYGGLGYGQMQGPSPTPPRAVADALPMSKKLKISYLCYICIVGFGILSVVYGKPFKHDFECSLDTYKLQTQV
ncbi:hypothetical protein HanPI659440_Chr04g0177961 [Helianthus annuus]|nr:hypothetical protein HanPI659440_Chr04g0177961 [Helianthus annuus]